MRVNCIIPRQCAAVILLALLAAAWPHGSIGQQPAAPQAATEQPAAEASAAEASAAEASAAAESGAEESGEVESMDPETRALWDRFEASSLAWGKTVADIREVQIRFHNGDAEQMAELQRQFWELRAAGRRDYDRALADAIALVDHQQGGSRIAGEFVLQAIVNRTERDWLEGIAHGAELLLDLEVDYPGLNSAAGRGYVVEGEYERARPFLAKAVELAMQQETEQPDPTDPMLLSTLDQNRQQWERELKMRQADAAADDLPRVLLKTTRGDVLLELFEDQAPNTVANFISLVERGFYDELPFYQVLEHLFALTGDPHGDGSGDAGYRIPDEHDHPEARDVFRGSLVMAKLIGPTGGATRTIADTASSQFMITFLPLASMSDEYTVFGRVIEGMPAVAAMTRLDPNEKAEDAVKLPPDRVLTAEVIRKRDHPYAFEKLPK